MKSTQAKSGRKTTEVKATIPLMPPVKVMNLSADATTVTQDLTIESLQEQNKRRLHVSKRVSLKDLCADDKKRVANLIKELAKMGDEKEAVLGQLQTERREYEKQVIQLVTQQENILQEREDIQGKLFQCQELLSRYKDQLLEREEQLNTSITDIVNRKESQRRRSYSSEEDHCENKRKQNSKENKENRATKDLHQKYVEVETTKDRLRRPFTSMIDKEIAKQKQTEDGCLSTIVSSETSTTTPPRHKEGVIAYNDRIPIMQAFREPVMSSTQKSADIKAYVDEDSPRDEFQRLEPDPSPRSSRTSFPCSSPKGQRSSSPASQSGKSNRVGFKERLTVDNDELEKHSPQLGSTSDRNGSKEFLQKYRKLTPTERKHELLKQREVLLDEQKRLRMILVEQETQLKKKQDIIEKRRTTQQARMDYLERNGEFPDDADNDGSVFNVQDGGSVFEGQVDRLNLDRYLSEENILNISDREEIHKDFGGASNNIRSKEPPARSQFREIHIHGPKYPTTEMHLQDRYTRATSPMRLEAECGGSAPSTPRLIDAATSYSRRMDQSMEEVGEDPVDTPKRRMDAATSYSCRSPRSPIQDHDFTDLPKQNNLPLQTNRQKGSKSPVSRLPSTPGEKTLSVVEIVNSLEAEPTSHPSHLIRSSTQREVTPTRSRPMSVGGTATILSTGSARPLKGTVFAVPPVKDQFCEEIAEETAEESSLLEDIFFL
ncbi:protein hinderin-like isoform X3 [Ostrea edulis]|nr:protein hinderin-like isoform X3 [Ostrea edulis]